MDWQFMAKVLLRGHPEAVSSDTLASSYLQSWKPYSSVYHSLAHASCRGLCHCPRGPFGFQAKGPHLFPFCPRINPISLYRHVAWLARVGHWGGKALKK